VRAVGNAQALSTGRARCAVRRIVHLSIAPAGHEVPGPRGPMYSGFSPCVRARG
jgi:hypothetical protein